MYVWVCDRSLNTSSKKSKCVFARPSTRHRNVNMFRLGGGSRAEDKRLIHVVHADECSSFKINANEQTDEKNKIDK